MPTEKHKAKKEQIIHSAITVMSQIGYADTCVRAICDAANISIGTFYHYFRDKDELLNIILSQIDLYLDEQVIPSLTDAADTVNLRNFALGYARKTISTASSYGGVISGSNIPLPSTPESLLKEHDRPLYQVPRNIIIHGQKSGEFTTDFEADEIADHLITCLRGYSMDWARRNYSYDFEKKIISFIEIFCRSIKSGS